MSVDELLTTKQVCEQYPFNPGTLRFWRSTDQGPASFSLGPRGRVVYKRSEIERWLAEQEATTKRGGGADPPPPMSSPMGGRTSPKRSTGGSTALSPPPKDAA